MVIFQDFTHVLLEVLQALAPLLLLFFIFQVFVLKLPREYIVRVIKGVGLTFIGLSLFLQGVKIGFLPAGREMGEILGGFSKTWITIPIGLVLGFVATLAEPAVRIFSYEVEERSSGYIKQSVMLYTLSLGVAVFIAIGMARIIYGIPLIYLIMPGYILVLLLMKFSSSTFIAIAFDAGGVATGPMTVTFIMAMAVGVAAAMEGRDAVIDGFGLIALVALSPILSVLILSLIYRENSE